VHPQLPVRARTDWKAVVLKLAAAAVPILTLGAGSPVLMGVLAYRRRRFGLRSLLLWASVGVYLGVAVVFWSVDWGDPQEADSAKGDAAMIVQLLAIPAASVQAAIVVASRRRRVVDLNEASVAVLSALPGLTPQLAGAIVASRDQAGRFRSVDELWSRGLLPTPQRTDLLEQLTVVAVQDER
jgi:hypothetical protein